MVTIGCPQEADALSNEVQAAAEEAVALLVSEGHLRGEAPGFNPELGRVISVTTQVVSGIKYHLLLQVLLGEEPSYWEVDIVSQPWLKPPYTLVDYKRVQDPNID